MGAGNSREEASEAPTVAKKRSQELIRIFHRASVSTNLDFTGYRLGQKGAQDLARSLRGTVTVRSLNLRWNHIQDEGLLSLVPVLREASTIESLNFCGNHLSERSIADFCDLLRHSRPAIVKIDLSSNNLKCEGANVLASALETNETVQELDLTSNEIGAQGGIAFARMLRRNTALEILNLHSNSITCNGIKEIAKALEVNQSCGSIYIGWNTFGEGGVEALVKALSINQTVVNLGLDAQDIADKKALQQLEAAQQRNSSVRLAIKNIVAIHERGGAAPDIDKEIREVPDLLHGACLHGRVELVEFLAESGANLNIKQAGTQNTPLHVATLANKLDVVRVLVSLNLNSTQNLIREVNKDLDTALHIAARENLFEICQVLVLRGAPLVGTNKLGHTAEHIARTKGHHQILDFLLSRKRPFTVRGGKGDAMDTALTDRRRITKVEWFTIPLPGIVGTIGARHSLLVVTVSSSSSVGGDVTPLLTPRKRRASDLDEDGGGDTATTTTTAAAAANEHAYIIEKAEGSLRGRETENGVFISNWLDVSGNIETKSFAAVSGRGLDNQTGSRQFTMRTLHDIAVRMGKYDVADCNCHHMALVLFNACAKSSAHVKSMPDQFLTGIAKGLSMIGVNLGESTVSQSRVAIPFTNLNSRPTSMASRHGMYEKEGFFPIEENCPVEYHRWAMHTAALSEWIYHPAARGDSITISNNLSEEVVLRLTGAEPGKVSLRPGRSHLLRESMMISATSLQLQVERKGGLFGRYWIAKTPITRGESYRLTHTEDGGAICENVKHTPLPRNMTLEHVTYSEGDNLVQWGITSTLETIHVTFRGTESILDGIVDVSFLTLDVAGLRVHSGMWCALHQIDANVTEQVIEQIAEAKLAVRKKRREQQQQHGRSSHSNDSSPAAGRRASLKVDTGDRAEHIKHLAALTDDDEFEPNIVLSGHSLGGAYAILTVVDLLRLRADLNITAVITHGTSQVVVPPDESNGAEAHRIYNKLSSVTRNYVHAYDLVPRLPSCEDWLFKVIPSPEFLNTSVMFMNVSYDAAGLIDDKIRPQWKIMSRYAPVGDLIFISEGADGAMLLRSDDVHRMDVLGTAPEPIGQFVIAHHGVANYVSILTKMITNPKRGRTVPAASKEEEPLSPNPPTPSTSALKRRAKVVGERQRQRDYGDDGLALQPILEMDESPASASADRVANKRRRRDTPSPLDLTEDGAGEAQQRQRRPMEVVVNLVDSPVSANSEQQQTTATATKTAAAGKQERTPRSRARLLGRQRKRLAPVERSLSSPQRESPTSSDSVSSAGSSGRRSKSIDLLVGPQHMVTADDHPRLLPAPLPTNRSRERQGLLMRHPSDTTASDHQGLTHELRDQAASHPDRLQTIHGSYAGEEDPGAHTVTSTGVDDDAARDRVVLGRHVSQDRSAYFQQHHSGEFKDSIVYDFANGMFSQSTLKHHPSSWE